MEVIMNDDLMWEEIQKNEVFKFGVKWFQVLVWAGLLFSVGMVIYLGLQIIF